MKKQIQGKLLCCGCNKPLIQEKLYAHDGLSVCKACYDIIVYRIVNTSHPNWK